MSQTTEISSDINEPRLIEETGLDAKIAQIIGPIVEDLGFRLVRARMIDNNGATMQIMAERADGMLSVGECEKISKAISPVLDVEDPVSGTYNLEVSSPGIDRPLVRRSDFAFWTGHVAKIETAYLIDGRKRFRGHMLKLEDDKLHIARDNAAKGEEKEYAVPLDAIAEAKLVLTDDLVREALRRDKELRKANGIADDDPDLTENIN